MFENLKSQFKEAEKETDMTIKLHKIKLIRQNLIKLIIDEDAKLTNEEVEQIKSFILCKN